MSSDHQLGAPVCIIRILENGKFELDKKALTNILLNNSIRNKFVAVVSIAGDYRKGKSFLLNFLLRYLQSGCQEDWLDNDQTPLKGFSWKAGSDRDTTGILIWSQPFIIKGDDERDVAILLMDTQGIFDTNDTIQESAKVFSMSTLISSIQIYNLMQNLQEDNLQVLKFFTEYGQLVLNSSEESQKPFQKLMFLIRDCPFPEFDFGLEGGNSLLEKRLAIKTIKKPELRRVRKRIRSCFEKFDCFLMPYPGKKVIRDCLFDGKVADIDDEFIQYLKQFVSLIFDPSYLAVKEIGGQLVTAKDLYDYIERYVEVFASESLPEPQFIFAAAADVNNKKAIELVLNIYVDSMKLFCGSDNYVQPDVLESKHNESKVKSINIFDNIPRIGDSDIGAHHKELLIEKIEQEYKRFQEQNDNIKKSMDNQRDNMIAGAIGVIGTIATVGFGIAAAVAANK